MKVYGKFLSSLRAYLFNTALILILLLLLFPSHISNVQAESDNSTEEFTLPGDNITEEVLPESNNTSDNVTGEDPPSTENTTGEETSEILPDSDNITTEEPLISDNVTPDQITPTDNVTPESSYEEITEKVVSPDEEALVSSPNGRISLRIPKGAVSTPTNITLSAHYPLMSTGMRMINLFELNASVVDTKEKVNQFKKELELTIQHAPEELAGLDTDSLYLYYLDEEAQHWVPVSSQFDHDTLTLTANLEHFSYYGEGANLLQNGPGRVMAAEVNLHSGESTFNYPIELPPGPGGFKPSLALNYNSGSVDGMKNERDMGSWVGIGWSLHLGKVSYDISSDTYYLDLNGGSYELFSSDGINFKTNPEQYFKITRSGNTWNLYDRDGVYYRFGGTTSSQQYVYENSKKDYRWDLSLIQDTNGNQVAITYTQEIRGTSPQDTVRSAYPTNITYGNIQILFTLGYDEDAGTDGYLRYDNPKSTQYNPAPKIMETRRLNAIVVKINGSLYKKYTFAYTTTDRTLEVFDYYYYGQHYQVTTYYSGFHKLDSITQYGADGTSLLPSINFAYLDKEVYRKDSSDPENPASLTWPFLSTINSGYDGTISFGYTQIPDTAVSDLWSRQAVTTKTINPGIGPTETITYVYTGYPQYYGTGWEQQFRGWNEIKETDAENNYIRHWFYTTGTIGGKNADKLTGKEYETKWYDNSDSLLKNKTYDWSATGGEGTIILTPNVDGEVVTEKNKSSGAPWSVIHDDPGVFFDSIVSYTAGIFLCEAICGYNWWKITRAIIGFDTSALPDSSTILSATLSIYGYSKTTGMWFSPTLNVFAAAPSGNTFSMGTTPFCNTTIDYASFQIFSYNDFFLNANGLAAINTTGVTYFSLRDVNADVADNEPNCPYQNPSSMKFETSEHVNKPALAITWKEALRIQLDKTEETVATKTSRTRYVYDDYGNVITQYLDGDISTNEDDAIIHREYYPNTSSNILSKVAREYITNCQENIQKETLYYFDGNNTSLTTPPTKGNLTRLEQKEDASNSVSSYFTYDTYGNMLTSQDPNGNITTWTYDPVSHFYPSSRALPVTGLAESYAYTWNWTEGTDNGTMKVTTTDVNGYDTISYYDTFDRLSKVVKVGDNYTSPSIEYQYNNWGTLYQQHIKTIIKVDETTSLWQSQYFDGLGRVIQVHASGESGHTIIISTSAFNNRGLFDKQYVSQDIASVLTSYQEPDAGWKYSTFTYDALGRVVTQTGADNTTISHDYSDAWQDLVTNQNGNQTRYHYDAFNRLAKVEELDDSFQLYGTTTYTYDVLGNLIQVKDNDNNTTSMTYDWLSRKTDMIDPDMGHWIYDYDNNGNLTTQTDAKNQVIDMDYDELNRLVGKSYSSANMTDVSYSYDEGTNGKGRLTSMTDASGNTTYQYDERGRLVQETRIIAGSGTYVTEFGYDGADRNTWILYPTGENVTQTYNGRGLPYSLSGNVAGSVINSTLYNSLGMLTEINLGNGLRTTYGYYDTGGTYDTAGGYYGRLWEIRTLPQEGGDALQDVQHAWDAGGNLVTRQDVLVSETETFTYDFLDRLTGLTGPYTESYNYDEIGNIMSRNGVSYSYSAKPHAVTAVGTVSYEYDANGNMTVRGEQAIIWDAENHPVTVSQNGTVIAEFVYDGDGNRVKKIESGETILYINRYYEINLTTGNATSYYYLGGQMVAMKQGSDIKYVHQDHLTGTSLMTDTSGNQIDTTMKYLPFGETRAGSVPTDKLFTGQRLDNTGLYYYNARYYDPEIGRFISPDTIIPNPANPQSFNRYSYVLNNPLKYIDPSGLTDVVVTAEALPPEIVAYAALLGIIIDTAYTVTSATGEQITGLGNSAVVVNGELPTAVFELANTMREKEGDNVINIALPSTNDNVSKSLLYQYSFDKGKDSPKSLVIYTWDKQSGRILYSVEKFKHSLPIWEKIWLTIDITFATGLFIGVAGAATVAAPPMGIFLVPAAGGAAWAWWEIVSNIWKSE